MARSLPRSPGRLSFPRLFLAAIAGAAVTRTGPERTGVSGGLVVQPPITVITAAALGGLLYLVIANLSGASQFWASLVTIAAVIGGGGASLRTSVSSTFGGIGFELWSAAKLDAQAWNVTWLPALPQSTVQWTLPDRRGVAAPQIRKNLEAQ